MPGRPPIGSIRHTAAPRHSSRGDPTAGRTGCRQTDQSRGSEAGRFTRSPIRTSLWMVGSDNIGRSSSGRHSRGAFGGCCVKPLGGDDARQRCGRRRRIRYHSHHQVEKPIGFSHLAGSQPRSSFPVSGRDTKYRRMWSRSTWSMQTAPRSPIVIPGPGSVGIVPPKGRSR